MIARKVSLGLALVWVFYAALAWGQTYKCRNANGQLTYVDSPCTVGSKTEKVIAFTGSSPAITPAQDSAVPAPNSSSVHQGNLRYLDMKIDEAISARDFGQAKQLALTPEHWKKIKDAEEPNATPIDESSTDRRGQLQSPQKEIKRQQQSQQQHPVVQQQAQPTQQQRQEAQSQQQAMQHQLQQMVEQAQQQQKQDLQEKQQHQQNEIQAQQQLQQQEAQRMKQALEKQVPVISRAMEQAGGSAAATRDLMIQNQVNQLNQTAKGGVAIQIQKN